MFGSKAREREAHREAMAASYDAEAKGYDLKIKDLRQRLRGDSEAVRYAERQYGNAKATAEWNAASYRVGRKQKRR